jgi:hypothetical protein
MSKRLSQIFQKIEALEPPEELAELILKRIEKESNRLFRAELFLTRLGFAGSLFVLFYTFSVFGRAIVDSEFWKIASLISSDMVIVLGNWQAFGYSLLETLPIAGIIAILLPLFTLFLSFNFYLTLNNKHHGHPKVKTA